MKSLNTADTVACAAKLCQASTVCHYGAPRTAEIVDALAKIHPVEYIESDSFPAALNSAMGAELAGKRAFLVSSIPMDMSAAAYMRLPLVVANVSSPRGLLSVRQDHSDIMMQRDTGALVFMPESNIDAIESIVQAYKTCEDAKVLLPAIVNIDLAHFSESLTPPGDIYVKRFLSTLKLPFGFKKISRFATAEDNYHELKKQQQKAMKNAIPVLEEISMNWKKNFKRSLPLVDSYKTEDADYVIVIAGYHSTTAKAAVDRLRAQGKKVGAARLRVLRPWPDAALKNALKNAKKVAVYDQAVSLGAGGVLHGEAKRVHNFCSSFIALGRYPSEKDFMQIFEHLEKSQKEETVWL